jgi:SAM-dependent methyltransferase
MTFDEDYFRRLYVDAATRVYGPDEVAHLAGAVASTLDYLRWPLRAALDVGAGTGMWGDWLRAHRPDVAVRSVDISEHACRTYGHEQRDIATWVDATAQYDLVICHGVVAYLDDAACAAAIDHLAAMTRGFLYLSVVTEEDVRRGVVDRERSDLAIHIRPARFYLDLLDAYYIRVGMGLFAIHTAPVPLFALERAD